MSDGATSFLAGFLFLTEARSFFRQENFRKATSLPGKTLHVGRHCAYRFKFSRLSLSI